MEVHSESCIVRFSVRFYGNQVSSKTCAEGVSTHRFQVGQESWLLLASSKRLRVVVDTSEKGVVAVDNKESRKRELVTELLS